MHAFRHNHDTVSDTGPFRGAARCAATPVQCGCCKASRGCYTRDAVSDTEGEG
jgi:hypothetical protein